MENLKSSLSDKFWKLRKGGISYRKACFELRLNAASGKLWRVNYLIDGLRNSKNKNVEDEIGLAMERAATNGQTKIIELMLNKKCGETLYKEPKSNPVFCNSGAKRRYEIQQKLSQDQVSKEKLVWETVTWKERSLLIAANGGHTEIVQQLIDNKVDIHILNDTAVHTAINSYQFDSFSLLVDSGANISTRNYEIFHTAIANVPIYQSPEFLDKLLEQDIKIPKKDMNRILENALGQSLDDETKAKVLNFAKKSTAEPTSPTIKKPKGFTS